MSQASLRLQCFDQLLEWQVLVGLCIDRSFPHLIQNIRQSHTAMYLATQYLRVHKETNQASGFNPVAIGYWYTHANVLLSCVAVQ